MGGAARTIESATGPRSPQQLASAVFGLYAGLVYLTPLFGGLAADGWLGRTRTVVAGASLMAPGHFLMASESSVLLTLACLLVGVGCFKGNIAAQAGELYAPGDKRRASAFWGLHAALVATAGALLLGVRLAFGRLLAAGGATEAPAAAMPS
jgi:POT family proton-dependent oligopeptide transporter